jgi:hypothetical protein
LKGFFKQKKMKIKSVCMTLLTIRSLFLRFLSISIVINVCGGQAVFVAVGGDNTINNGRNIAHSIDGIGWTIVTTNIFSVEVYGVAYSASQNKWIAVGQGTINTMAWSPDGITWTGLGLNCFPAAGNGITYSPEQNRWVAVGDGSNSIWYSTDGLSWTVATAGLFNIGGKSVVYSSVLNQWVAVGWAGNSIAVSSDGITWTGLGILMFVNGGRSVKYANGIYVVAGAGFVTQAWSTDGVIWTGTPEFISSAREDAVYAEGRWLLVGAASVNFQNSTTGKSWTNKANFPGIIHVEGIIYNSAYDRYVGVGIGGANTLIYSSDGDNWNGAGAIFSNYGLKVATTGRLSQIITNATAITTNIVNLITNTSIIQSNTSITVSGSLTILGNFAVDGQLTLTQSSIVNVTGILGIKGNTTFNGLQPIRCQSLTISSAIGASQLEVILSVNLTMGASVSYPIVTYGDRVGTFSAVKVRSAPTTVLSPNDCPVATQDYSSSTLTVTVTMTSCNPVPPNLTATRISTEVIVGIAIGSAVGAAAVILILVFLMKRHRDKMDAITTVHLRNEAISDLKQQHDAALRASPGVNL